MINGKKFFEIIIEIDRLDWRSFFRAENIEIILIEPELKSKAQKRAEQQHDSLSRYIIKLIEKDLREADIYIYTREHHDDVETFESSNLQEVINYGDRDWNYLTAREQDKCRYAYIIKSSNPYGLAEDGHFDGDYKKVYK